MLVEMVQAALKKFSPANVREFFAMVVPRESPLDAETIARMLETTGGHIGRTAVGLGISRRTLQKKMREFNVPAARPGRKSK